VDNRTCTVIEDGERCPKPLDCRGMCGMHLKRFYATGSPHKPPKPLPPSLPGERWLPVVGWEGLYEVSNMGRVRSLLRQTPRGMRGNHILTNHLWHESGYFFVGLSRDGECASPYVHALVLEAFAGPRPDDHEALHGPAGNQVNCWPENLRWGTPVENAADKLRDGTAPRGERCGAHKLTAAQVLEIRRRRSGGEAQKSLAAAFGVSRSTISYCTTGRTWTWL